MGSSEVPLSSEELLCDDQALSEEAEADCNIHRHQDVYTELAVF